MTVKRIRLLVAAGVLAGATLLPAAPAQACFNPDEPTCRIHRGLCFATEDLAKYRDKVMYCW
jgi:hypothetical protein